MSELEPVVSFTGFPTVRSFGYGADPSGEGSTEPVAKGDISEADLRTRILAGGRITSVAVSEIPLSGDYVVYLRLADEPGFLRLATRKRQGPKAYRDFRLLHQTLVKHGYLGRVCVYPLNHPALARMGIPAA